MGNVLGLFDVVVLRRGDEEIVLSREEFTGEVIVYLNLFDEAFEDFFEFLKIRKEREGGG